MQIDLDRDIMPLFPTPVFAGIIDFPGASLLPHLEGLDYHPVHESVSRTVFSESTYEMALFSRPEFAVLGEVVSEAVNAFARDVLRASTAMRVVCRPAGRSRPRAR